MSAGKMLACDMQIADNVLTMFVPNRLNEETRRVKVMMRFIEEVYDNHIERLIQSS